MHSASGFPAGDRSGSGTASVVPAKACVQRLGTRHQLEKLPAKVAIRRKVSVKRNAGPAAAGFPAARLPVTCNNAAGAVARFEFAAGKHQRSCSSAAGATSPHVRDTRARLHRHHPCPARWLGDIGAGEGLLTLFIRHTSASLTIQENADPDVLRDLLDALERLAPRAAGYRHASEGPDDMPGHIASMLTATSLSVPVAAGRMLLGTWQALYLIEHRDAPHRREVVLHYIGE